MNHNLSFFKKLKETTFFQSKSIALGAGNVTQFLLIENKYFFSIIFYKWHTIDQVRYHTHAFPAVAFLLNGWYWEKVLFNDIEMENFVNVPLIPRILPRGYTHMIGNSKPGTRTMVIAGPWSEFWWEYFPDTDTWVKYTWGRKVVEKIS